ncbi:MAG: rubrerythrin family protein [Ignavibacteriales bacterium]
MSKTTDNLKEAFAGESQAYQKYLAFAMKAEKDGFPNVARLFRTAAEAEHIHAEGHLKALDGIGSTMENLKSAIEGETYEYKEMYPPMLEQAIEEEHKAKRMFNYAVKAEEVHAQLYKIALEAVAQGKDLDECKVYLCPVCGHIEFGTPPEKCPICGTLASKYVNVEM